MKYVLISINASDTYIHPTNPGILEVPVGKQVTSLRKKDIDKLVHKKGKAPISKAIQNLLRWNTRRHTKSAELLKDWAEKAADWVHTYVEASSIIHTNIDNSENQIKIKL